MNDDCCKEERRTRLDEQPVADCPEGLQGFVSRYIGREIRICPLNVGYMVQMDCHRFAFENLEKLMLYLDMYLKDPKGTEEKWFAGKLL